MENVFIKPYFESLDNRAELLPTLWTKKSSQEIRTTKPSFSRVKDSVTDKHAIQNAVIDVIRNSKKMLVLCSFLLADEEVEQALLEAEVRGVRVYCMIAAEARLDREDPEGEFDKKVLRQHKEMLKKLAGKVMFRTSSSFHAKVVLADPSTSDANGVLLTANITTDAMRRNEELLLKLEEFEIKQLAAYLKWAFWEVAEHESIESGKLSAVKALGITEHPAGCLPVLATTEKARQISEMVLAMIQSAQTEIQVSCFGWDLEHPVVQALIKKAQTGVKVTVLARTRPSSMSALEALAKAGAVVLGFKWLHAKALVVDQREAMVMSANFQKHGLDEGFELGIVIEDDRLEDLLQALQLWQTQAQWQLKTDAKLGEVLGLVQIWDGKSLNECDVKESRVIDLGETPSSSAENLQAPRPNLPRIDKLAEPVHELKYEWRVVAPRLANGAKEEYQKIVETDGNITKGKKQKTKQVPYNPRVYKQPNGQRVVAIKASQDLASARRLKTELKLAAIVLE